MQDYQRLQKDHTLFNTINGHKSYYQSLLLSNKKQIVSKEEWDISLACASGLENGEYTANIITNPYNLFQVALYYKHYKALIDILYINHKRKEFRVIDIKSTDDYLESFNIFKYRYDFQLAFYTWIVQELYPDYLALPPIILAVSKKEPDYPEPFEFKEETIRLGEIGGERDGVTYKGFRDCINYYDHYLKYNNLYNSTLTKNKTNLI